jgi:hypothetical protein
VCTTWYEGVLDRSFQSGVKNDPLSLLLCLFIDRIEKFIAVRLPAVGAHVALKLIRVLLYAIYADDLHAVVLLAESLCDLQTIIEALHEFCCFNATTVNKKKSEVVIFIVVHANQNSMCCVNKRKVPSR